MYEQTTQRVVNKKYFTEATAYGTVTYAISVLLMELETCVLSQDRYAAVTTATHCESGLDKTVEPAMPTTYLDDRRSKICAR